MSCDVFSFKGVMGGDVHVAASAVRAVSPAAYSSPGKTAIFTAGDPDPFYSPEDPDEVAKRWRLALASPLTIGA